MQEGIRYGVKDLNNLFMAFDGKHLQVNAELDSLFAETYPLVNRQYEYKRADLWIICDLRRKKKNYKTFISNWLHRAQKEAEKVNIEARTGAGPSGPIKIKKEAQLRIEQRGRK